MRKFKFFTVLKLVSVIMLCTSCGTAVDSTSISEVEKTLPAAQAAEQISIAAEITKPVTTTTTTVKKETKKKTTTTKKKEREYVVYKPSTHYIHRSTCSWVTDECYEIESTNGLEVLVCEDCNPDMAVETYYEIPTETTTTTTVVEIAEPEETTTTTTVSPIEKIETDTTTIYKPNERLTSVYVDEYSRQLLAEIVYHEAGCSWLGIYDKARIASGVMNRVYDDRFPNTVYDVLVAPGQFTGYTPGCCVPTQACYDAVDYYFANQGEFDGCNSWTGDGYQNYFYFQ